MRILMITSVWPTAERPSLGPVVVRQVDFLRREGVDVDVFHLEGNQNPWNYVRAQRAVRKRLRQRAYDLIHAQWGQAGLAALPRKLPLVVTLRGSDVEGFVNSRGRYTFRGRALSAVSRIVAARADQVILVAKRLADRLPRRSYHVIPSGLDLELFKPQSRDAARKALGLDSNRRYVLFAGSKSNPIKRYDLAAAAVDLARSRHDVELIAAEGCSHSMMPSFMNACDALLLTSHHEGSPDVVKEALACDLPVVSVNVGDVGERIASVEGCMLCEDTEPATIARNLDAVLSTNARVDGRTAIAALDEMLLTRQVISVYRKALDPGVRPKELSDSQQMGWSRPRT